MIETLSTEDECREYLEELVWNGQPKCPYCSCTEEPWKLTSFGRFRENSSVWSFVERQGSCSCYTRCQEKNPTGNN